MRVDYDNYWVSEDSLTKSLRAAGWTSICWWMEDMDSFGPLVRGVSACNPNGEMERAFYG